MDTEDYQTEAERTLPPKLYLDTIPPAVMYEALSNFIIAAEALDGVKKMLVYGRPLPPDSPLHLATSRAPDVQYAEDGGNSLPLAVIHGGIGMATETGEILEGIVKSLFKGELFDFTNAVEEGGDVAWYLNRYLRGADSNLAAAFSANTRKLAARHLGSKDATGTGFNPDAATEAGRDRAAERAILEETTTHRVGNLEREVTHRVYGDGSPESQPNLGLATTGELLAELAARAKVGGYANYRTVDDDHEAERARLQD